MNALAAIRLAVDARSSAEQADVIARNTGAPPSGLTIGSSAANTSSAPSVTRRKSVSIGAGIFGWKDRGSYHAGPARVLRRSRSSCRSARVPGVHGAGLRDCRSRRFPPPPTSVSKPPTATRTLHGFHAVASRLRLKPRSVHAIYATAGRDDARMRDLLARAAAAAVDVHAVAPERLDALAGTPRHQ